MPFAPRYCFLFPRRAVPTLSNIMCIIGSLRTAFSWLSFNGKSLSTIMYTMLNSSLHRFTFKLIVQPILLLELASFHIRLRFQQQNEFTNSFLMMKFWKCWALATSSLKRSNPNALKTFSKWCNQLSAEGCDFLFVIHGVVKKGKTALS